MDTLKYQILSKFLTSNAPTTYSNPTPDDKPSVLSLPGSSMHMRSGSSLDAVSLLQQQQSTHDTVVNSISFIEYLTPRSRANMLKKTSKKRSLRDVFTSNSSAAGQSGSKGGAFHDQSDPSNHIAPSSHYDLPLVYPSTFQSPFDIVDAQSPLATPATVLTLQALIYYATQLILYQLPVSHPHFHHSQPLSKHFEDQVVVQSLSLFFPYFLQLQWVKEQEVRPQNKK
jgi:hypothetical protein